MKLKEFLNKQYNIEQDDYLIGIGPRNTVKVLLEIIEERGNEDIIIDILEKAYGDSYKPAIYEKIDPQSPLYKALFHQSRKGDVISFLSGVYSKLINEDTNER